MSITTVLSSSTTSVVQQIQEAILALISSSYLLQANNLIVSTTPDIDLSFIDFPDDEASVIENLPVHQNAARSAVAMFSDDASAPLEQFSLNVSDIIGFINVWDAYYPLISQMLDQWQNGSDVSELNAGIESLRKQVKVRSENCQAIISILTNFQTAVKAATEAINADETTVKDVLDGENGVITQLKNQINDLTDAMAKDNAITASGTAAQAESVGVIVLLYLSEGGAEDDEQQEQIQEAINTQIEVIRENYSEQSAAERDWKEKFDQYKTLIFELEDDEMAYTRVLNLATAMNASNDTAATAVEQEQALQASWGSLNASIQAVEEMANSGDQDQVDTAKEQWKAMNVDFQALKDLAISLQDKGQLAVGKS